MIPMAEPWIGDAEAERVLEAVNSGWISPKGKFVTEFEEKFAEFIGVKHAFATSTGTAALHLSLRAAGVGAGDEVIVPDLTWIACANVVQYLNATPRFVDVDQETYTLDPEAVREQITEDTAAVMPVHIYGQPCQMGPLLDIADEHDLCIVEDAAEAHGAMYDGDRVGSVGDVGCFSFYGNKILTTGQGGMITTDDEEIAGDIQLYRRDGMSTEQKYYHPVIGYNYRLTNVQAAIGVAQVNRAEEIIAEKQRVAKRYREQLDRAGLQFQADPDWGTSVHWMTAPVFDSQSQRDRVRQRLENEKIQTRPFFYPLHKQPPYCETEDTCSVSVALAERGLNLPSGPHLTDADIDRVCTVVADAVRDVGPS